MSQTVSLAIIAICMLVITVAILGTAIALLIVALAAKKSINKLTSRAQPLISQATETVKTANSIANTVKARTEGIIGKAEDTVDDVSRRIKTTTNIIQESISPPMINIASLVTGVSRGLEVLGQSRRRGGNGHGQ